MFKYFFVMYLLGPFLSKGKYLAIGERERGEGSGARGDLKIQ